MDLKKIHLVENYVSLALAFLLLILFFSCQEDDNLDSNTLITTIDAKSTLTTVSAEDIPEIMAYVNDLPQSKKGHFSILTKTGGARTSEPDLVLGALQLGEIKVATNAYNRSNYTFLLKTIQSQANDSISTFNLVLKDTRTGIHSYIVEYRMASNGVGLNNNINSSSYSGKIIYYNIDGLHAVSLDLANGSIVNSFVRNPCPGDGDDIVVGNGPGGGGGTGGGGTGGGDTGGGDTSSDCVLIAIPCGCEAHWPWECGGCPVSPPGWLESCSDDKVMENGVLKLDFIKNTRRCPGDNTHCAAENDCEYGWNDDCSCAPEPSDEPEEDENTDVAILIPPFDPCEKLGDYVDNPIIANIIQDLDGAYADNNERGFGILKNPDNDALSSEAQNGTKNSVDLPWGGNVIGGAHAHTDNGYPMFSGDDIAGLYLFYRLSSNRTHPTNPTRPTDVFQYLETSVGTFFISIENFGALNNLINTNKKLRVLNRFLERGYSKADPASQTDFAKAFLKTIKNSLENENIQTKPISLFRLNSDNETLVELELDENEEISETPC